MVQGVEVGGDQVHGARQPQTANVLSQQADVGSATVACGDAQHVGRNVDGKDRHAPAATEVARKKTRAAADVRRGAELDSVPLDQSGEQPAEVQEDRNPEGQVVGASGLAVRTSRVTVQAANLTADTVALWRCSTGHQ